MTGYWLGVDLGGTKILSGLFDDNLKLLARSKQPTSADGGPSGVFARIVQGVEAVVKEANVAPDQIRGMGLDHFASTPVTFPLGVYIEPLP